MKKIILLVALSMFLLPICSAYAVPVDYVEYLHVNANIDGKDYFEWADSSWRFRHLQWQVPTSATVNGQYFFPLAWGGGVTDWYEVTGVESLHDVFGTDVEIYLDVIQGRDIINISQYPTTTSDNFSVWIDDNSGSRSGYEFKIWGYGSNLENSVVPEPTTMALFGLGLLGAGVFKRRKK